MRPDRPAREGEAPAEPPRRDRRHPAHGVLASLNVPTIVFVTVCTRDRRPWLADAGVHAELRTVWADADAWLVGRYVLMPDHLHLFCAPNAARGVGSAGASPSRDGCTVLLDNWVRYWKSQFSRRSGDPRCRWQADHWDTRLRREQSYDAKWDYVVHNPVRAGLVARSEDWPFAGELHRLPW